MREADHHDWYLRDWMHHCGLKAARIVDATGWQKSKVSRLVNGTTPYDRNVVNAISAILHIEPYELLMRPADAIAIRNIKDSVARIAAETRTSYIHEQQRDGTFG